MKRFYCTVCQKVKRVQKWPNIINWVDSEIPSARTGECNHHRSGRIIQPKSTNVFKRVKPIKAVVVSKRKRAS